jgi:hypothetical protein
MGDDVVRGVVGRRDPVEVTRDALAVGDRREDLPERAAGDLRGEQLVEPQPVPGPEQDHAEDQDERGREQLER